MTPTCEIVSRARQLITDLDLVRAAEIARRCGVSRTTVIRWRQAAHWRGGAWRIIEPVLPPAHVQLAGEDYWSWQLLNRIDPKRFPPHPGGAL